MEAIESIAFAFLGFFLLRFSAQKSHVKPSTYLTPCQTTTSIWHVSYAQPATINRGEQKTGKPVWHGSSPANLLKTSILGVMHLL
jgi:hypothetical protein